MSSTKAYTATIESLKPHSNANKLQLATILGNQVVVGLDAVVNTSGVLFLPDAIISQAIVDKFELTYLANNRVRVVKLRGEYSEALFIPMSDEFITDFGLNNMWEEYVPPQRKRSKTVSVTAKKQDTLNKVFPKHKDTQQYLANRGQIEGLLEDGWEISYSIKTHGTSGRSSKIRLPMEPSSTEKTLLKYSYYLGLSSWYSSYLERKYENKFSTVYTPIYGSRNVVFKPSLSGEVSKDFRKEVHSLFEDMLHEDECIYYEILGYEDTDKPIMEPYKGQPYDYGIPNGSWGVQIYRITQDGRELNPRQLELRCNQLNVMPVCALKSSSVEEAFAKSIIEDACASTASTHSMLATNYTHTNEGLVIRLDKDGEVKLFKYKNREFLLQEGILPPQIDGEVNEQTQQEIT